MLLSVTPPVTDLVARLAAKTCPTQIEKIAVPEFILARTHCAAVTTKQWRNRRVGEVELAFGTLAFRDQISTF